MEYRNSSPDQGSFYYAGFNGFGCMRPARDNILNKTFYAYVPLSRMPRDFEQHRRSMSQQIVIDITEEEEAAAAGPNLPAFPLKRETPSLATDCPIADLPTVDGDEHQREASGNTHMVANRPLERVQDAHVPSLKQMQIQHMLNPTTPWPHGQDSQHGTSNNPLFIATPSTSSVLSSYGSPSISSTTLNGDSAWISEKRHGLIIEIHDACLEASNRFIRLNTHYAHDQHHGMRSRRYRPYGLGNQDLFTSSRASQHTTARTLMDNISRISTHIWREARRDIMARHRAEADAVRRMRDLYAWGEIVVRSVEYGWDYESEDDGGSTVTGVPEDGIDRICEAARWFCLGLSDQEAWNECDGLARALEHLQMQEGKGEGEGEGV